MEIKPYIPEITNTRDRPAKISFYKKGSTVLLSSKIARLMGFTGDKAAVQFGQDKDGNWFIKNGGTDTLHFKLINGVFQANNNKLYNDVVASLGADQFAGVRRFKMRVGTEPTNDGDAWFEIISASLEKY